MLAKAMNGPARQLAKSICAGCQVLGYGRPAWLLADLGAAVRRRPQPPRQVSAPRCEQAAAWLTRELAGGPGRSDELVAAAGAVGIPRHQLYSARLQLGIQADRHGQHWIWRTP